MVIQSWCCSGSSIEQGSSGVCFSGGLRCGARGVACDTRRRSQPASKQVTSAHFIRILRPPSNPHIQRKTPGTHNVVVPAYAPASGDGLRWLQLRYFRQLDDDEWQRPCSERSSACGYSLDFRPSRAASSWPRESTTTRRPQYR